MMYSKAKTAVLLLVGSCLGASPCVVFGAEEGEAAPDGAVRAEAAPSQPDRAAEPKEGDVKEALWGGRKVQVVYEGGEWVLDTNKLRDRNWTNDLAVAHRADDTFLDFNGETLTWGQIDAHIDLLMLNAPLSLPPGATAEDVERVKVATRRQYAQRLGEMYVRNALLAQKARAEGISVTAAELGEALTNSVRRLGRRHRDEILAKVVEPGCYFSRNQENYLLTRKYRDEFLRGGLEADAAEIDAAVAEREEERTASQGVNATLRPRMEAWLAELRDGSRDFAETVFDESDTPDDAETGEWGEFERDEVEEDDEWTPEMRAFAFTAAKDALGGVFETEGAYVILKVLKTDGRGTATLARIVKEKFDVPDALTREEAKALVLRRKLGQRTQAAQEAALKAARLTSVYPIRLLNKKNNTRRKLRR